MYLVFTRMPRESYRRQPKSLLSYLCYVFRALINSLVWRRTQFSPTGPLPCQMTKWNHHLFFQIESTEQCTCEVFKPTLRLALLTGRCRPAVVGLQQTFLTDSKSPSFTGFNILTKYSLKDRATGGVSSLINDSYLFSEVHFAGGGCEGNTGQGRHLLQYLSSSVRSRCQDGYDHPNRTTAVSVRVLGDFNGHSPEAKSSVKSKILKSLTPEDNCWRRSSQKWIDVFLNDGSATYFHPAAGSTSALDLSICGP